MGLKFGDLEEATINGGKIYIDNLGVKYKKINGLPWSVEHNRYTFNTVETVANMTFEEVDEEKEKLDEALGVIKDYCNKFNNCNLCKIKRWCDKCWSDYPDDWEF